MVPEPPLEECLLLGGIRGLLVDFILHRVGDLKPGTQSKSRSIIKPPVSHATKYTPQVSQS